MRLLKLGLIILSSLPVFVLFQNFSNPHFKENAVISAPVFDSTLTIKTSASLAGAIGSITWKGKEFINADDHGRELQSASSFNGLGECFNPNEAGSKYDGHGSGSTSRLLSIKATGNQLSTTAQLAYWRNCIKDNPADPRANDPLARSATGLSKHKLSKKVTIGAFGMSNVIDYRVTYHVPENYQKSVFEIATAYMPTETVSKFYGYNPEKKTLHTLSNGPQGQKLPIIFSSSDNEYAMGIYSPDIRMKDSAAFGDRGYYDRYRSDRVVKWNAYIVRNETPAGDYTFQSYVIVGSRDQVIQSIDTLYRYSHRVVGHIDGFIQHRDTYYLSGWACALDTQDSIRVHAYVGGPAGKGQFLGAYSAYQPSEFAVAQACKSDGTNYRFLIPLPPEVRSSLRGKALYVYGISPTDSGNPVLSNAGKFIVP